MSTPKVVFKNKFTYEWHIGSGDLLDYYQRPQAFRKSSSLQNKENSDYDFINYMQNDEKSDGCFSSTSDFMTEEEIENFRKLERNSQSEGCPKYVQVISFDNKFLEENGIIVGGNLDTARIKAVTRTAMNKLIESEPKFDKDNVYWCGAIHINTDNVHIHTSLLEKHRRENRQTKYKDKDMISVEAFDKLKSAVASSIIKNDKRTEELTRLEREILLPKFKENFTNTTAQMQHLIKILPKEEGWQYNRPKMKRFRPEIDKCVDNIIQSNPELRGRFTEYLAKLDSMSEFYKDLYGEGNRYKYLEYKTNKLNDFYARAGNQLLKELVILKHTPDSELAEIKKPIIPKLSAKSSYYDGIKALKEKNIKEAEKQLSASSDKGYKQADYQLGKMYLDYLQLFPDKTEKAKQLLSAQAEENTSASYQLGMYYYNNNDYKQAESYLLKSAEKEHAAAQLKLGLLYLAYPSEEKNVSRDTSDLDEYRKKGLYWLEKSALNNNHYAQCRLGIENLKDNPEKAIEWLKKSASQDNKVAINIIKQLKEQHRSNSEHRQPIRRFNPRYLRTKAECNYQLNSALYTLKKLYKEYERRTQQLIDEFEYEQQQMQLDNIYEYDKSL